MENGTLKKVKIGVAALLVGLMVTMLVILFVSKGSVFDQKIVIDYPDGCTEVYENEELITDLCTRGREMLENPQTPIYNVDEEDLQWQNNLTGMMKLNVSTN